MKKILLHLLIILLTGMIAFLSCTKEYSCERCNEQNQPPLASAGKDTLITLPADSVLLDGRASFDPDGAISAWQWTKLSGPASFAIAHPKGAKTIVKNLSAGVYLFELKVTDDGGASATDTVQVRVDAVPTSNHPPVACAGPDRVITLPTNMVTIDGSCSSDPDNNITSYYWSMLSAPSPYSIGNVHDAKANMTLSGQGVYLFELKVTDAGGLFSKDTVQITVNHPIVNQPPACTNCKIVFVSNRDGNAEIYSCNADGSNILRLTNNASIDEQPAWSPDGSRIAFVSDRTGHFELYIMNADGSNVVRKTFSASYSQNPAWSPDGMKVAYTDLNNGSANIWVVDATSGAPSLLFENPGFDAHPAWSPDGTKIALVSDWNAYDILFELFTINADGTNFKQLMTGSTFNQPEYVHPSWSPSGTKIAMAISKATGLNEYNTQVGVINRDGSGLTAIISGAAYWTRTSWSPDGTVIAYTSLSGSTTNISWVSADGSKSGTIVTNGWNADWQH